MSTPQGNEFPACRAYTQSSSSLKPTSQPIPHPHPARRVTQPDGAPGIGYGLPMLIGLTVDDESEVSLGGWTRTLWRVRPYGQPTPGAGASTMSTWPVRSANRASTFSVPRHSAASMNRVRRSGPPSMHAKPNRDRKSTRLNSSHVAISYAVFCLKKKKTLRVVFWIENKKKNKYHKLNM